MLTPDEKKKRHWLKVSRPLIYDKIMKYGARIIQFQYNYACNMKCIHCCTNKMQKKSRHFHMPDVKELARQVDEIGISHFTITGGEPLLFRDLDTLVATLDPQKFFIAMDTNGWLMTPQKARHLKKIGIEKVHISLDSIDPVIHDRFRKCNWSWARAMHAMQCARDVGLSVLINTVVTKSEVYSVEFERLLDFTTNTLKLPVVMMLAKPAGEWAGRDDLILTENEFNYVRLFEKRYNVITHLTPAYGCDVGCIAGKRWASITRYGDVMPCPWLHISFGNFFEEPLSVIMNRIAENKWFKERQDICLGSVDSEFMRKCILPMEGKPYPVSYKEVF